MEEVNACHFCGNQGQPLYRGLRDRGHSIPGEWSFSRCPRCGLVWLNPRLAPEDADKAYPTGYSTHLIDTSQSWLRSFKEKLKFAAIAVSFGYNDIPVGLRWRILWRTVSLVPLIKEMGWLSGMCLNGSERGSLLDIGCGSGQFLGMMCDLGWKVLGVEPDARAAHIARERYGVGVIVGTMEDAHLPEGSVDAVTMHHVFEHVPDPAALLRECHRVLKPHGKMVIVMPNGESLGHRLFKESWGALEPPRHLYLWPMRTVSRCVAQAGFSVETLRTSCRGARVLWASSLANRINSAGLPWWARLSGLIFQAAEQGWRIIWKDVGEEIVLVARKDTKL